MSARDLALYAATAAVLAWGPPAWSQGKKVPAARKQQAPRQAPASQPARKPPAKKRTAPAKKRTAPASAPARPRRKRLSKKDQEVLRDLELLENLRLLEAMDLLTDTRKKGGRKK